MYNYIKFEDEAQIAYSDIREDQTVRISIERPVDMGFDYATCLLPRCQWTEVEGFTPKEIEFFTEVVRNNAPLIYRLAREAVKFYA